MLESSPKNSPKNPVEERLFAPGAVPVLGQRSAVDSASLAPGFWAGLQNVRFTDMSLRVRDGAQKMTASPPIAAASFRGSWTGLLNGTLYVVAAFRVGASTQLFRVVDPTLTAAASWTWVEITKASTRFANDFWVSFAPVRDISVRGKWDILVCSNGSENPRLFNTNKTSSFYDLPGGDVVGVNQNVPAPDTRRVTATPAPKEWLMVKNYASFAATTHSDITKFAVTHSYDTGTATAGGANTLTDAGAAPPWSVNEFVGLPVVITGGTGAGQAVRTVVSNTGTVLTVTPAWAVVPDNTSVYVIGSATADALVLSGYPSANGNTAEVAFAATPVEYWNAGAIGSKAGFSLGNTTDGATSNQVWLVVKGDPTQSIWSNIQIDLYSAVSGAYLTITPWSPVSSLTVAPFYEDLGDGYYLVAFSLEHLGSLVANLASITKIKFTWVGPSPTIAKSVQITNIMAGGLTQGGSSYAVSYSDLPNRSESPGVVATNGSDNLATLGAPASMTKTLPLSQALYYQYEVAFPDSPSAIPNYALIYRMDPGDINYYFLGTNGFFTLAGTPTIGDIWIKLDSGGPEVKDLTLTAPDSYHQTIPIGSASLAANDRLYIGGVGNAELWISELKNPFRFRSTVRYFDENDPDLTSPVRDTFAGETVTQLLSLPGSFVGVSPVLCLTTRAIWRIEGTSAVSLSRPTLVAPHGCPFPRAFASYQGRTWLMDSERQIRETNGGMISPPITLQKVSDMLRSGSVAFTSMVANFDKVYCSYRRLGESTTTRMLVYDLTTGEWCEDLLASGDIAGLMAFDDGSFRNMYCFSDAGHVYHLEAKNQTTDDGAAISVVLTARTLHSGLWDSLIFSRIGLVTDKCTTLVTTRRFCPQTGQTVDGQIDLSKPATGWAWAKDTLVGGGGDPGLTGVCCQPSIRGDFPGGTHIRSMMIEIAPGGDGPVSG